MIVSIDKPSGNPVSSLYLLHKSSSLIHILYDSWFFAKIPVGLLKLKGSLAFYFIVFSVYLVDAIVIFSNSVFVWCWWYSITHCSSPSSSHHIQVSANWKFRRFSDFPVQWENWSCSEAVTSRILPSFRCLLFSTFDVWAISNTRLAALLDGSCVRIKRRNRFLGSSRRGRGGAGRSEEICQSVRTRSWSNGRERCKVFLFQIMPSCNGCIGAGGRSNGRECARTVKSVAPRCRAAKLVPPLSTPDQLTCQDQWDVVWEVEGGERWERLLLSASDLLLVPLQLWPSSPGGGKQSDVTLIITAANHSNHSKCETARIGLWFHLCQILRSIFCTKGSEVKSNDSGHSHKKSLNPTPLSDNFSEQSIVSWRLKIMPSPVKTWNWSFQYFLSWSQCKWSHMWWGSNTTQFPSPVPLNVTTRDRFCHLSWHFRRWLSVTWF